MSVEPVRRAKRLVERRPARGGHDLAAKLLDEDFAGATGAPSGENHRYGPSRVARGCALRLFSRSG